MKILIDTKRLKLHWEIEMNRKAKNLVQTAQHLANTPDTSTTTNHVAQAIHDTTEAERHRYTPPQHE